MLARNFDATVPKSNTEDETIELVFLESEQVLRYKKQTAGPFLKSPSPGSDANLAGGVG